MGRRPAALIFRLLTEASKMRQELARKLLGLSFVQVLTCRRHPIVWLTVRAAVLAQNFMPPRNRFADEDRDRRYSAIE